MVHQNTLTRSALTRYRSVAEIRADLPAFIQDKWQFQAHQPPHAFDQLPTDQKKMLVDEWIWVEEKAIAFSNASDQGTKLRAAEEYLLRLSSNERTRGLIRVAFDQRAEIVWPLFLQWWSDCDGTYFWGNLIEKILSRAAAERSAFEYYDCQTRERMAGLPELVPVWRGCAS